MGKRLGALGAVIAVVALAVGIALPAAGSTGNAAQDQTIRVTAVTKEQKLFDLGGPGFSLGNEIVFSQKLLQGTNQVGHDGSVCTEVSVARQEAQCIATYSFPGGRSAPRRWLSLAQRRRMTGPSPAAPANTRVRRVSYTSRMSRQPREY
jgi:hypothetical protein